MKEIPSAYDPKQVEDRIYELWEKSGAFSPEIKEGEKPFVIVIPPPNVTGSLHMGHALNNTIQDILIRRSRMKGVPTLWIPGTDHAGIATQNVVEKQLAKEGKNRNDLGREEFVKRVWQHVDQYGHIIIDQLKKMGCSCDWSRQRFTMDKGYTEAVNAAFKHYYDKGLIYQGERVINWCVKHQTALSDIEVEYREEKAKLYYIKYGPIALATTRPETKFGDTAIAVHPDDKRYQQYIGKTLDVESVIGPVKIKVIADETVDPKFGTGAVKVTPAHDPTDFEIGQRHHLPIKIAIDKYGKMTEIAGKFAGLKRLEAREKVTEEMKKLGILEKVVPYKTTLPYCYRCGTLIEPLISKQWFLKMKELIKPAIEAIATDQIKLTPTMWKKVYLDWMENIRDWCISRQIWWGHRLPVYQQEEISKSKSQISNNDQNSNSLKIGPHANWKLKIYVGDTPPEGYKQSTDVLDTWFSSALWPFATLGWPPSSAKATEGKPTDLKYFYPTTILSTARDINMLWVVRMIFSGLEFMKEKPFEQVYVHPTVFNLEGKRMSKSLGTGIDPLELIEKYGADAVRFGLTYINTGTQDIKFDENAILAGKKFANKIWNISRFVLQQTANSKFEALNPKQIECLKANPKSQIDKDILQSLSRLITSYNHSLDDFKFGQAAHDLYDFVWHDLADTYLEGAKTQMENLEYRVNTTEILLYVLVTTLKLLHPIMPFLSEEIWQELARQKLIEEPNLITASWPSQK